MSNLAATPLPYLVRPSSRPGPSPLLVLLHGFGADEHDLFGLAPFLDDRLTIASVQAPYRAPVGGRAWFELRFSATGPALRDFDQARDSITRILATIDEIRAAYSIAADRVILGGFSQGAVMTAAILVRHPDRISAALLMSGMVLSELVPDEPDHSALAGKPVLMIHGTYDEVVAYHDAERGRSILGDLPIDLHFHSFPMGHEINQESLTLLDGWLRSQVDRGG